MKYKWLAWLCTAFLLAPSVVVAASPAPQATPAPTAPIGLKIAPAKYEATLQIGQSKDGVIDVINVSGVPVTVQPSVENTRMVGDNGELQFYAGTNAFTFENLIQIEKDPFTLGVGEARHVRFRVTMPVGIFPGGHFGVVFFKVLATANGGAGAAVAQSGQVGTLLLFTVAGDVDQKGSLESLTLTQNRFSDQKKLAALYANTGNTSSKPLGVAYQPTGELRLKDMVGLTIRRQPLKGDVVFPGAKRKLLAQIRKPFWLGRYTAEVSLSPGPGKAAQTKSVAFWAISPLAAGVLILLAIVIGAALSEWWRRRRRALPTETQSVSLMDDASHPPGKSAPKASDSPDDGPPEKL